MQGIVLTKFLCLPDAALLPRNQLPSAQAIQDSSRMFHKRCFHPSSLFLEGKSKLPAASVRWGQVPEEESRGWRQRNQLPGCDPDRRSGHGQASSQGPELRLEAIWWASPQTCQPGCTGVSRRRARHMLPSLMLGTPILQVHGKVCTTPGAVAQQG